MLLKGKPIAQELNTETAARVQKLQEHGITPLLAVILVGDDAPSATYVRKKEEKARELGLDFHLEKLPASTTKQEIIDAIKEIQKKDNLAGLIVQLPLPEPLYTDDVLNAIDAQFDVDCLTNVNLGKLVMKTQTIAPPTPSAVMSILEDQNVSLAGKNVVIIGVGALVGKPLAIMMMNQRASVTTCNSATKDTKEKCLAADIIVTGVGKPHMVTKDMVRPETIVIDTGVSFPDQRMSGDVDADDLDALGCKVTPTPGGVGPLTVAHLLRNTAILAEENNR